MGVVPEWSARGHLNQLGRQMTMHIDWKKLYETEEQKMAWKLLGISLLFLHLIFLPEIFALPACINFRNPFHLYRQNLSMLLLLSALPLLSGKIGGRVVFFFYGLWGLFNSVMLFSLVKFHLCLDYTTLQILSVTDPSEVHEFCGSFLHWYDFLPAVIVVAATIWCMRCTQKVTKFSTRLGLALLVPFLLAALPSVCKGKFSWFGKRNALCRFALTSIAQYSGEMQSIHEAAIHPVLPAGIRRIPDENADGVLGVVVVGESARRANFQCYGYPRPTTPRLLDFSSQCLFFDDVIAPATSTLRCCAYDFSDAKLGELSQMHYSICDFLLGGGYQVGLYSNQRRSGSHESLGLLFHKATEKKYLMEEGDGDRYDIALMDYLTDSPLVKNSLPAVVFLHTMGSHHHAKKRYPASKKFFDEEFRDECNAGMDPACAEYVNDYDNSIRVTDEFLGEVMAFLDSLDRPAFLLYLSDHAEMLLRKDGESNFRDSKNPFSYEIPFVVFTNCPYREAFPDFLKAMAENVHQPLQADATIYAIASLARLTCDDFPYEKDVTSPQYIPAERYLNEDVKLPYPTAERGGEKAGNDAAAARELRK